MLHQPLAPPTQSSPFVGSSQAAYGIEDEFASDTLIVPAMLHERSPSPSAMLFDQARQSRHPADREPTRPPAVSEQPRSRTRDIADECGEVDPWAGSNSPLPSFEESQRTTRSDSSESPLASRTYTSVASGPLARLSQDVRAGSPNADSHSNSASPATSKRGFFSSLLQPLLGGTPRQTPQLPSQPSPSTSPSPYHTRNSAPPISPSPSHNEGLGLGLGPMPERELPRSSGVQVTTSASSPAALSTKSASAPATTQQLMSMGLRMASLTPALPHARTGLPHCGIILDDNYLLLGTSLGLDFIPLDGTLGAKLRRPISLIKKTRFRQLAILKERSNVLLAIAGRNDHVRVYALDGIRSIIEKKMREASYSYAPTAPRPASTSVPILPSSRPGMSKGKGRADPPPPLVARRSGAAITITGPLSPPPPYRRPSVARLPPSPTRPAHLGRRRSRSVVTSVPAQSPSSSLHSRKSRETLSGRRPSAIALGKRRASSTPSMPSATSTSSLTPLRADEAAPASEDAPTTDEEEWIDAGSEVASPPSPARRTTRMMARSPSVHSRVTDEGLVQLLAAGPPPELQGEPLTARMIVSAPSSPIVVQGPPSPVLARVRAASKPSSPKLRQSPVIETAMRKDDSHHSLASSSSSPSLGRQRIAPRSSIIDSSIDETRALSDFFRSDGSDDIVGLPMKRSPSMRAIASVGMPRSASVGRDGEERLGALVDFLNEGPPSEMREATTRSPTMPRPLSQVMPRSASIDREADAATRDLAQFLREDPPPSVTEARAAAAARLNGATGVTRSGSRASTTSWRTETNASPIPPARESMTSLTDSPVEAIPNELPQEREAPTARQRKRWSMLDAVFRPNSSLDPSSTGPSGSGAQSRRHSGEDQHAGDATVLALLDASFATGLAPANPPAPTSRSQRSSVESVDAVPQGKRSVPPLVHTDSEYARTDPSGTRGTIGGSSSDPAVANYANAETHPASATAPLEYVKLARTKGARMFKAIETRKKTYLAVLCGDAAERIELFTGSRNVSLSLNRTFVLPETPRSIEFQLQGDELVDIYLVYDESIFALEPATVRVREVGVARNERRAARRDRDRDRQTRLEAGLPPLPSDSPPEGSSSAPHRRTQSTPSAPPTPSLEPGSTFPSATASPALTTSEAHPQTSAPAPNTPGPVSSTVTAIEEPAPKLRVPPAQCFTTWQQLAFIPPVPPSVLASAFVIPPTYDSVVGSTPAPKQAATFQVTAEGADSQDHGMLTPPEASPTLVPLLSPISLLANHPSRHSGPPGLFFVSRGRHMTNIVDGDGRSVIRRAISWDASNAVSPDHEVLAGLDIFQRLELVLVDGGRRTVVVAFGPTQLQVIEVGPKPGVQHQEGEAPPTQSIEVAPAEALKRKSRLADGTPNLRDVTFLGKAGETCFWSERVGPAITVHCLSAS